MEPASLFLGIAAIIFSIILHEVAHGFMADWLGDPTARYAGRLTLNPIPHIDPVGSVILPGLLALTSSPFLIGWAKPVPYNPYNLSNQRWGEALVGFAGPATNILIALVFGILLRFGVYTETLAPLMVMLVISNLWLALLNLVPIPPLDGSKILKSLLPYPLAQSYAGLEGMTYALGPIGLIGVLLLFIYVLSEPLGAFVYYVFSLLVGA